MVFDSNKMNPKPKQSKHVEFDTLAIRISRNSSQV